MIPRVFVAIRPSEELLSLLTKAQKIISYIPARWIPKDDLHCTLVPPWNEDSLDIAIETLRDAVDGLHSSLVRFKRIEYGPREKNPSLIWATGIASKEVTVLRDNLLRAFEVEERRPFTPHITIARFRKREWLDFKDRTLDLPLEWEEEVSSVSLYESPHKGGIGYSVLHTEFLS